MKENDWIVANINNPEFTASDFKNIQGLSLDNTQLLSKDDYLKSSLIVNNSIFQNEEGVFDKNKFNEFYSTQAKKFSDFQQESALDNYTYGFWDTSRNNINIFTIGYKHTASISCWNSIYCMTNCICNKIIPVKIIFIVS